MTDFVKGQRATVGVSSRVERAGGWGPAITLRPGDTVEVTAVRKNTITVKCGSQRYSYNIPRENLKAPNGETWTETPKPPKPKPRKIGETPEGGIAPDDPRLAWLWEDAAKVANKSGYCGYYDRIADELNIPGRKRDITVSITHDGITLTAGVQARSRKEAEALIREKLGLES